MANSIKRKKIKRLKKIVFVAFALIFTGLLFLQGNENGSIEFIIGGGISVIFAAYFALNSIEFFKENIKLFLINLLLAICAFIISIMYFLR